MPNLRPPVLASAIVACLYVSSNAKAAGPEPGDAACHNLRYEDDFSYLVWART